MEKIMCISLSNDMKNNIMLIAMVIMKCVILFILYFGIKTIFLLTEALHAMERFFYYILIGADRKESVFAHPPNRIGRTDL
jgi:hypothetical protein